MNSPSFKPWEQRSSTLTAHGHHLPLGSFKNAAVWAPSPEILTWVIWRLSMRCFKTPQGHWLVGQMETRWPRSLCLSSLSGQSEWRASGPVLNAGAQPHLQKQNMHLNKSPGTALSGLRGTDVGVSPGHGGRGPGKDLHSFQNLCFN